MGKGSSHTTSTTVVKEDNNPWPPIAQPIKDVNLVATNLAANAVGPAVFPGARTAPMSLPTQAALLGAAKEAVTGFNIGKPLLEKLGETTAQGGLNDYLRGAGSVFGQVAAESTQPGQANPYFKQALNTQLQDAADRINSYFSSRGRYGSGAHNRLLARELGNVTASALFDQFNQDRNRALSAAQGLYGVGNAAVGNLARVASVAPTIDKMRFSDFDRLLNVGSNIQNYQQRLMDETRQIFEEQNNLPWRYIDMWQNALNPAMVRFGSSSGTNTASQSLSRPWNPVSLLGAPMMAMGMK